MTTLQYALLGGALVGLGITVVIAQLLPAHVDARWAIRHLDPERTIGRSTSPPQHASDLQGRAGLVLQRRAPQVVLAQVPVKELAILQRPVHSYLGEKALLAFVGLAFPPLATVLFAMAGSRPPVTIPVLASLGLAVLLWFAPDLRLKGEAKQARIDFVRALASYVDLVALERISSAGTHDAMRNAAKVGDSWVFARILEELDQAQLAGEMPWEALKTLGDEFDIAELNDIAEIMRLSREEDASVYNQLRARAESIRNAQMSDELAKANAAAEQLSMPLAALLIVFIALLGTPAMLAIL